MATIPQNQPYDLTTEQGRLQSYAHSAHGAYLASVVEECLEEQKDEMSRAIIALHEKEMANLNPVEDTDDSLLQEFSVFQAELGIRDRKEFEKLRVAYSEERLMLHGDIALLKSLVNAMLVLAALPEHLEDDNEH